MPISCQRKLMCGLFKRMILMYYKVTNTIFCVCDFSRILKKKNIYAREKNIYAREKKIYMPEKQKTALEWNAVSIPRIRYGFLSQEKEQTVPSYF
jgi:hypothetical protein